MIGSPTSKHVASCSVHGGVEIQTAAREQWDGAAGARDEAGDARRRYQPSLLLQPIFPDEQQEVQRRRSHARLAAASGVAEKIGMFHAASIQQIRSRQNRQRESLIKAPPKPHATIGRKSRSVAPAPCIDQGAMLAPRENESTQLLIDPDAAPTKWQICKAVCRIACCPPIPSRIVSKVSFLPPVRFLPPLPLDPTSPARSVPSGVKG